MATKRPQLDDIPEIVNGSEGYDAYEPEVEEAPAQQRTSAKASCAVVTRQFVANDYLTAPHPSDELYQDVMSELGEGADPWKATVSIKMGRKPTGEQETFMIRVNGRKFDLAYRQTHDVPLPIAIAWLDHETGNEIAEDLADSMTAQYQRLAEDKIL